MGRPRISTEQEHSMSSEIATESNLQSCMSQSSFFLTSEFIGEMLIRSAKERFLAYEMKAGFAAS